MMKNKIVSLLICLCALPAHALQIHTAVDDAQIKAKISNKETSRITLVNDRVKQFFINQGRIVVEKDEAKGDLYITPTEYYKDKDVNLFITSENGKTFSLLLTPTAMPSATIAVKPTGQNDETAKAWEIAMSYEESLIKLIKLMAQGTPPKGYQVSSVLSERFNQNEKHKIESVTKFSGNQLTGFVLIIKNRGKHKVKLNTSDFSYLNPLATAIERNTLYPSMKTRVFLVKHNG